MKTANDSTPVEQVVLVSYSYENTGFKVKTGTEELGVMPLRVIDGARKLLLYIRWKVNQFQDSHRSEQFKTVL